MEALLKLEEMSGEEILDSVYADWFPNARTEEELEYELECASWNND
jgi:hypothetical protein